MEIIPVHIPNEIVKNDDLCSMIINAIDLKDRDILVIAQKIISKQEGMVINLESVVPSLLAKGIASQYGKDPRIVELVLRESKRIVRMERGVIIVETNHGYVCANAGIDESNLPRGFASLLPKNSDNSARKLRNELESKLKINLAIVISDTFGRPFRMGQTNHAIGISGISPVTDYRGTHDSFGNILQVTSIATVDEICGAAELVMKKTAMCPIVVIRDLDYEKNDQSINQLIRSDSEDLFK